jgi:hypothetical protein
MKNEFSPTDLRAEDNDCCENMIRVGLVINPDIQGASLRKSVGQTQSHATVSITFLIHLGKKQFFFDGDSDAVDQVPYQLCSSGIAFFIAIMSQIRSP